MVKVAAVEYTPAVAAVSRPGRPHDAVAAAGEPRTYEVVDFTGAAD